jgi:uncharacterized LabA/DUF88 family protein
MAFCHFVIAFFRLKYYYYKSVFLSDYAISSDDMSGNFSGILYVAGQKQFRPAFLFFGAILEKTCVFVDGENLRHSICDLFETEFDSQDYLPNTSWDRFFDSVVEKTGSPKRFRTYWYAIAHLDVHPQQIEKLDTSDLSINFLKKSSDDFKERYAKINKENILDLKKLVDDTKAFLTRKKESMRKRFDGWHIVQDRIATDNNAIEFRRAGAIRFNCFNNELGNEKAVDVKLAIDLLKLHPIYDVAVLVSGDQDYVPAVQAVKDLGKRVVNICFTTKKGNLLPGGSKHLNKITDSFCSIDYLDMKKYMGL